MNKIALSADSKDSAGQELAHAQAGGGLRGLVLRGIERLSGLQQLRPQYEIWRRDVAGRSPRMFNIGLDMLGTRLAIHSPQWPAALAPDRPLVMVCNHPFGIGDGIAALALAEDLGRPFRVLLNRAFMRVPEVAPYALPIDFEETPEALATNLATRKAARKALDEGATLVVFPGGGVATAPWPFARARELPWKSFAARLILSARADVLPVYFEGQNSAIFHTGSLVAPGLRMSLLVAEFRRFMNAQVEVRIGAPLPYDSLRHFEAPQALTDEIYLAVQRLAPHNAGASRERLLPPAQRERPAFDAPLTRKRR